MKSILEHGYVLLRFHTKNYQPYSNCRSPTVKRVVYTSSGAAIVHTSADPLTFSEADWNEESPTECARKGAETSALHMYRASKTLAERGECSF